MKEKAFFGEDFIRTMALPKGKKRKKAIADIILALRLVFQKGSANKQTGLVKEAQDILIKGSDEVKDAYKKFWQRFSPGIKKTFPVM